MYFPLFVFFGFPNRLSPSQAVNLFRLWAAQLSMHFTFPFCRFVQPQLSVVGEEEGNSLSTCVQVAKVSQSLVVAVAQLRPIEAQPFRMIARSTQNPHPPPIQLRQLPAARHDWQHFIGSRLAKQAARLRPISALAFCRRRRRSRSRTWLDASLASAAKGQRFCAAHDGR